MKVNVTGRGFVPGANSIAPVYNKDLTENQIRRILNINTLRVFESSTGGLITKKNIDVIIKKSISNVSKVVTNDTQKTVETTTTTDEPKTDDVVVTVNDEPVSEVEINEEIETTSEPVVDEVVDEIVEEEATTNDVDETEEIEETEETPTTETVVDEKPSYYNNKNKNKKHRK